VREAHFGRNALANAGDVCRRDVHDVRVAPAVEQGAIHTERATDVGVKRLVDGRVKADRRCAMDDDVDVAGKSADVCEAAVDNLHPLGDLLHRLVFADAVDPIFEYRLRISCVSRCSTGALPFARIKTEMRVFG